MVIKKEREVGVLKSFTRSVGMIEKQEYRVCEKWDEVRPRTRVFFYL